MIKPCIKEYKTLNLIDVVEYFESKGFKYSKRIIDMYTENGNNSYSFGDEIEQAANDPDGFDVSFHEFAKMIIKEYGHGDYLFLISW